MEGDQSSVNIFAGVEARNQERRAKITAEKRRKAEEKTISNESTTDFHAMFKASEATVRGMLETATTMATPELPEYFKSISALISELRGKVVSACTFLPTYDIRQSQSKVEALSQATSKSKSKLVKKAKFGFKNRSKVKKRGETKTSSSSSLSTSSSSSSSSSSSNSATSSSSAQPAAVIPKQDQFTNAPPIHDTSAAVSASQKLEEIMKKAELPFTIADQSDATVFHGVGDAGIQDKDLKLSQLTNTTLSVCSSATACRMNDLKDATILLGPVKGSVHIERADGCTFVIACRQLRIHYATNCTFYVHVNSSPIIEDTKDVQFAPYCLQYDGLAAQMAEAQQGGFIPENNKWDDVQDFMWLRAQQSPNWSVLPEDKRPKEPFTPKLQ
jgi:hypothetical protein